MIEIKTKKIEMNKRIKTNATKKGKGLLFTCAKKLTNVLHFNYFLYKHTYFDQSPDL